MSMLVVDKINDLWWLFPPWSSSLSSVLPWLRTYTGLVPQAGHWLQTLQCTCFNQSSHSMIMHSMHILISQQMCACRCLYVCVCVYTFVLSQLRVHTLQISELARLNPHQDDDFSIIQYIPGPSYHSLKVFFLFMSLNLLYLCSDWPWTFTCTWLHALSSLAAQIDLWPPG